MSKLSIQLVTYNGSKYIPYLFKSLREQTYREWELLVIDNNSTDNTVELIQNELANFPVPSRVIVNKENVGFAKGHNQAFRESQNEYFLVLNQDIYLEKDCLDKLMNFVARHPDTAAVTPRLMRWDFPSNPPSPSRGGAGGGVIDSLGLKVFRNRRVVELRQGEEWPHTSDPIAQSSNYFMEVFGVSGACALLRRSTIDGGQIFDESYFMYKEDVDLAFRLRSRGYAAYAILGAVAYHDRTAAGAETNATAAKNKKSQSFYIRYHSYKNHLITLYKNEYWQNFILDFPWIVWYEMKKFGYFLLFDRGVLVGLKEIWKMRKKLKESRSKNKELRKVSWREMRKWWK